MCGSITGLAKKQTDSWAEELRKSGQWLKRSKQRELFAFLNKRETLCTPGFLLRRHVQANLPHLMREAEKRSGVRMEEVATLANAGNVPWPEELTKSLAKVLSETVFPGFGAGRLGVDSRQWYSYLEEQGTCNRETAIKLIFALDMDDATAAKFLLSNGRNLLSVRHPFDFICKFCLESKPRIPYEKAVEIMVRFEQRRTGAADGATRGKSAGKDAPTFRSGMTVTMSGMLKTLLDETKSLTEDAWTDRLVAYMVAHETEFTAKYEKKNQRKKAREDRAFEYASGFSLQNIKMLKVLLKYLAVLYPVMVLQDKDKGDVIISVETDEQGVPVVYSRLTQAMFDLQNIYINKKPSELHIPSKGRDKLAYDQIPFNNRVVLPLKNLADTLRAMVRAAEAPANARDINRSTVLLLAYFFMTGYQYISEPSLDIEERLEADIKLAEERNDREAGRILHTLRDVVDILCDIESDPANAYISCLNQFLACFCFSEFYPPFVLDRFVFLSLLADPLSVPLELDGELEFMMQLVISESFQLSCEEINRKG